MASPSGDTREGSQHGAENPRRPRNPLDNIAKIWQTGHDTGMSTMNISLPDALKDFVDEQVASRGYGTSSEYVRELIRKEQDRQRLRALLLDGAGSAPASAANKAYIDGLRKRVRRHARG